MTDEQKDFKRVDIDAAVSNVSRETSEPVERETIEEKPEETTSHVEQVHSDDTENESENISDSEDDDEYGIGKTEERMYTQAEVNEMFRKRFKNNPEQNPLNKQQQQEAAREFKIDENSDLSIEQQLENFVEHVIENKTKKHQAQQAHALEQQRQAEFEQKFEKGMSKYSDFVEVVGSQPFDDVMVVATRSMKDPAAFMYAASKNHPKEVERISKISDPYAKIVEIGRLEASMRKAKEASKTPAPSGKTPQNNAPAVGKRNLDSLIQAYGEKKINYRR